MPLITFTDKGIYCPAGDFYIDPWKKVKKAIITHGHSDHARFGHANYLCTHLAKPVIQYRLGTSMKIESTGYGEKTNINGINITFYPSGHIVGAAQVKIESKGETWVVTGDYKLQNDTISTPFEPVKCQNFVTESTFGLPIYRWKPQKKIFEHINSWWYKNKANGTNSILFGYSLGKAQRLLQNIDPSIGKIFTHGAIENINTVLRNQGVSLTNTELAKGQDFKTKYKGCLVIAPPSALGTPWLKKFTPYSTGIASGWMALRGARRRQSADRGFIISDHADWNELNMAVKASEAEKVFVTHGYSSIYSRWLSEELNIESEEITTQFEDKLAEIGKSSSSD